MYAGPDIIMDGLVFGYDTNYGVANNSTATRYYPGEPTTNLANPYYYIAGSMSGVNITYVGLEDGWSKYSMSGTFSGGTYPYIMYLFGVSFTGGTQFSTQVQIKTNVEYKFNYFGANGISYVNQPMDNGGINSSTVLSDGSKLLQRQGFAYTSTTNQPGYLWTNPVNNTTFNSATDFVYFKDFQIEQKAHCTPYTATSRSNTASLIDLENTIPIDLSAISFDSTAQPDFDGVDDDIDGFDFNLEAMVDSTLEAFIYMDDLGGTHSSYSIFGGVATGTRHGYHEIRNSGSGWKMTYWTSSNGWRYANTALSAGQYYHVVWVWRGLNLSWYLNGVADGTYTFSTFSPYSLGFSHIGSFNSTERFMNGKIPVAKIYQKALTAAEVKQNYDAQKNRFL